jgi:hypothetical protein
MKTALKFTLLLAIVALIMAGCTNGNFQIKETATHQAIAYGSGKVMGIAVNEKLRDADGPLSIVWVDFMERNEGLDMVPPTEVLILFNDSIATIALYTSHDPYGLITDLGVLLLIFGAQYSDTGEMTAIQPVPRSVLVFFGMGYANGRAFVTQKLLDN